MNGTTAPTDPRCGAAGGLPVGAVVVLLWWTLLGGPWGPVAVWAQPAAGAAAPAGGADASQGVDRSVFVPPERSTLLLLSHAQVLIDQGRFSEAVQCLGRILQGAEDFFYRPDRSVSVHRSLKAEAQRLLEELPRRGLEVYRLQYGPRAQSALEKAISEGDSEALAEVARRYFHTEAGYQATLLLGLFQLDQGRPMAAALTLKRLRRNGRGMDRFEPTLSVAMAVCWLRAGMPEEAGRVLVDLKERLPGREVTIGGRQVALFDDPAQAVPWLLGVTGEIRPPSAKSLPGWLMLHGDASRGASVEASRPLLNRRWRVRTTDRPDVETLIERLRRQQRQQGTWLLPGLHPLVVDGLVLMRTAKTLLAADCRTGKRIWEVPVDDPFEAFLNPSQDVALPNAAQLELGLRLRLWGDATYGTLSSDGKLVFLVEDLSLSVNPAFARMIAMQGRQMAGGPKPYNRLAAYDVHSGKLRWEVGGLPGEYGLPLAGTFFLGPPLPLMDQVYVVAEREGEIRLVALEARSGHPRWQQPLAGGDRNILLDSLRRLAGVSPSYADGILVCPTSNRSIVALELTTRSLLWGYTYGDGENASQPQMVPFVAARAQTYEPSQRWLDSSVVLVDGHVLITPVDSNQLHCLNLADGKLLWRHPRGDLLYLACVEGGKVVLVGRTGVQALRLADGEPAWQGQSVALPEGLVPCGMGFASGSAYYLPLSRGEVATIDLESGRMVGIAKSRDRIPLGNLVCYQDQIISQRADAVEAYWQLEALRRQVRDRLAVDPQDARSLAWEGEICWADGKLGEAIDAFGRSLAKSDVPATRRRLREALFEGLRREFPAYRDRRAEIEPLLAGPEERAVFLRLMATGLAAEGESARALNYLRQLIDLDAEHPGMEELDLDWTMRRDRWIQLQLGELWRNGAAPVRSEMEKLVGETLAKATAAGSIESLQRHRHYFGRLPAGRQAEKPLAEKLLAAGRLLEAELLWMRQLRAGRPEESAAALARWAEMLRDARRWDDAARLYARLGREFAQTRGWQNRTGREWVEALPEDDPVARRLGGGTAWPVGAVRRKSTSTGKPTAAFGQSEIPYEGGRAPFFSHVSVELNQAPVQLVGRDGWGNRLWSVALEKHVRREHFAFSRALMRASVCGHLLLVSLGDKILALDTLGTGADSPPRVAWTRDLQELDADSQQGSQIMPGLNLAGGWNPFRGGGLVGPSASAAVVMGESLVCVKRFRDLMGIDPATGQTLWVRHDAPLGGAVFGDPEYVFVVPPNATEATVLSAEGGKLLGKRAVPVENERFATLGRMILRWSVEPSSVLLELIDPWQPQSEQSVWGPRRFPTGTRIELLDRQAVAVFEPGGHFVLLKLADGAPIVDQQLEAEEPPNEIVVFRMGQQYLLIVNHGTATGDPRRRLYPLHVASRRIGRAKVYGFGPDGKKLWPQPVVVEDQFLPLNQPRQLPVLTFACTVQENRPQVRTRPETSILCVDTRTGRVVCRQRFPNRANRFQISGDPEKKTVEIALDRNAVELTFTDRPLSEMEEAAEGEAAKSSIMAIWDALRRAALGQAPAPNSPQNTSNRPAEVSRKGTDGGKKESKPKGTGQGKAKPDAANQRAAAGGEAAQAAQKVPPSSQRATINRPSPREKGGK